jgi:hypothetical protein
MTKRAIPAFSKRVVVTLMPLLLPVDSCESAAQGEDVVTPGRQVDVQAGIPHLVTAAFVDFS